MPEGKKHPKKRNFNLPGDFIKLPEQSLPPLNHKPEVLSLCKNIDSFFGEYTKKQRASDLLKGAYYAKRIECKPNEDWMSQSANSAREILYPLFSPNINKDNILKLFKRYAVDLNVKSRNKEFEDNFQKLDRIYHKLTDITHHGLFIKGRGFISEDEFNNFSEKDFDILMDDFIKILNSSFNYQQIYIHNTIDVITKNKKPSRQHIKDSKLIIGVNYDAKQYFYTKVKPNWLNKLWRNNFLDVIKDGSNNQNEYNYRTPEINYISRCSEKCTGEVVKIINNKDIATTKDKFNPELIDQLIRISEKLHAKQLAKVIPKIYKQKWIKLMNRFNRWGFEYEKMFETLINAGDYKSFLLLSQSVLDIKTKEEFIKSSNGSYSERPFYFDDLSYTKVFEFIKNIPDQNLKDALSVTINSLKKIIKLGDKTEEKNIFNVNDPYCLYLPDVDFFSLDINQSRHSSFKSDIRDLIAVITILTERIIRLENKNDEIKKIYLKYFKFLPKSKTAWKLNLYVLSLRPEIFKVELKKLYFKLFNQKLDSYGDIISGTEYLKSLKIGFGVLSLSDQNTYINNTIKFFKKKSIENPDQTWHLSYGSKIFSVIFNFLNDKQKEKIRNEGFVLKPEYNPEPSIVSGMAGTIIPQPPIQTEDFASLKVEDILDRLKDEWSPVKLKEKYKNKDDFLKPHNAEGVGSLIEKDLDNRLQEYIDKSEMFFDRELINPHYTYSFLRGIENKIKNNKNKVYEINWDGFFNLCIKIKNSNKNKPFTKEEKNINSFDGWLAEWTTVHSAMADILEILASEENYKPIINFKKYRNNLFEIISYLIKYKNPEAKDEEKDTASMTSGSYNEQKVSDPFTMAINTVRGKAFQALMNFVFPDGRDPKNIKIVGIKDDTKKLYEETLENENTKALMFMFGHYLPSFYYRDIKWFESLLPKIFPIEESKKYLFISAWEGFLANNVYNEIFYDDKIQELYKYSISLDLSDATRNYFRDPKEGLANHIAIAFLNYKDFDFNHPLYKLFWNKNDPDLHSYFVSFIGRNVIHSENNKIDESVEKSLLGKKRIRDFWDWVLKNYENPKLFSEFGFWINTKKDIFSVKETAYYLRKTLEKTNGYIEWDYQLSKSAIILSKESPEDMIHVARLFFLDGKVRNPGKKDFPIRIDQEWIESFKILYNNQNTQLATKSLIDDLLKEGGSPFWCLNDILN